MKDYSIDRALLLNMKSHLETVVLPEIGLDLNADSNDISSVSLDLAYDISQIKPEKFNSISVYQEGSAPSRPIELGNETFREKSVELGIIISSLDPEMAHEIATMIQNYFDANDYMIVVDDQSNPIGEIYVEVYECEQVQPKVPIGNEESRFWWRLLLEVTLYAAFE